MEEERSFDFKKAIGTKSGLLTIAFLFGVIFLCLGFYNLGYNGGYEYVKDYKDRYMEKNCICKESFITEKYENFNIIKNKEVNYSK